MRGDDATVASGVEPPTLRSPDTSGSVPLRPMSPPDQTQDPRIVSLPASEIRRRFVEFFEERGHTVVPSASLVPAGDQTLLFTNSGMVQFKEVFTGAETRSYTRAVDYQRCLRVAGKHNDFEEVGRTPRHHTLFEMLGNWSFGDYFKREAIHWAWDFLTERPRHPRRPAGRDDLQGRRGRLGGLARRDRPAAGADGALGRRRRRATTRTSGGWPTPGRAGRAARSTSTAGREFSEGPHCMPDHDEHCPRWLEIWNLVFMEFDQRAGRPRRRCRSPSVDTGMGLERLASVLQQVPTNYDTDLFTPIHARMRELLGHDPDASSTSASATRSSPTTRGPSRSSSPTTSCHRTRAAATSCAGSCAARSATAGSSAGASRSWPRRPRS